LCHGSWASRSTQSDPRPRDPADPTQANPWRDERRHNRASRAERTCLARRATRQDASHDSPALANQATGWHRAARDREADLRTSPRWPRRRARPNTAALDVRPTSRHHLACGLVDCVSSKAAQAGLRPGRGRRRRR
jgi:hypothetical protein